MTATTTVLPGTWVLDPDRSSAHFTARGLGTAHGTVPVTAGRVEVTAAGLPVAVDAVLDIAALATGSDRRDKDLRSPRFLDTATHPVMRFESRTCTVTPEGWQVAGVLRVAGHDAPVTLDVRTEDGGLPTERTVVATGVLDRRDAGVNAPSILIRRQVRLEIRAVLTCS